MEERWVLSCVLYRCSTATSHSYTQCAGVIKSGKKALLGRRKAKCMYVDRAAVKACLNDGSGDQDSGLKKSC